MQIIQPHIWVENYDPLQININIERACRTCYRSENKIKPQSYKKLIANCIDRHHESVLEHEKVSIRMLCDIGVYKDLTRHRIASFSIESTRYCNYSKDKFENQIKFIDPVNIPKDSDLYIYWRHAMERIELNYIHMSEHGATPDQLRMLLPHSTAAEVCMTANIREWRHILSLRCSERVHPAIQQLLIPLLLKFKKDMPELFNDIPYNKKFNPNDYAELQVMDNIE